MMKMLTKIMVLKVLTMVGSKRRRTSVLILTTPPSKLLQLQPAAVHKYQVKAEDSE